MKRRIGTAFVLTAATLAGVAGVAGLGGCGVLPGLGGPPGSSGSGSGSSGGSGSGKVLNLPERTVYSKGDAADPSAGLTTGAPVRGPLASMSPLPTVTSSRPVPSLSPTECTGAVKMGVVNGLEVTPGTISAVVTWWNIGDPAITEYQLAAVSQQINYGPQPGWTWQSVAPGKGCTRLSATVTGLTSQVPYVFVLHALLKKYESLPPTAPEVARSEAVRML